jgi:cystathionine gamma-synthase
VSYLTSKQWTRRTLAVQALGRIDETTRAVVPPIHVATTFIRDEDNQYRSGNVYGRPDNETVREAERVIATLEGAKAALVFGSGMSAATSLFLALSPGDHVIGPRVMYWSLRNWLMNEAVRWGLKVDLVEMSDLNAVRSSVRPGSTKLLWAETPANP